VKYVSKRLLFEPKSPKKIQASRLRAPSVMADAAERAIFSVRRSSGGPLTSGIEANVRPGPEASASLSPLDLSSEPPKL
jgi:hypothetical protein